MATINGSFSGYSTSIFKPYVVWTVDSQDQVNNTSEVTATLYFAKYNAGYNAFNTGGFGLTFRVNTSANFTETFDLRSGTVPEIENIKSRTVTVAHNSDGTKSIVISASGDTEAIGTISLSSTVSLPTIPREAYITNSSVNFTVGDNIDLTLANAGNFYVKIELYANGSLIATRNAGQVTSYTFNPSSGEETDIYDEMPNATSTSLTFRVKTYSDSGYTTQIGSNKDKTGTVSVDTTANKPTFTTFTYANVDETLVNTDIYSNSLVTSHTNTLTGSSAKIIKGFNQVRGTISTGNKAVALNSATMSKYTFVAGAKTKDGAYSGVSGVDIDLDDIVTDSLSMVAVDSRSLSTSVPLTATLLANYSPVALNVPTLVRDNGVEDGTTLTLSGSYWKEYFGGGTSGVQNTITAHYRYKETTVAWAAQTWNSITLTDTSGALSYATHINGDLGASGFDPDKSFDIQVRIYDKLTNVIVAGVLSVGTPVLHITKLGMAVGDKFDSGLNALQVTGGIAIDGTDVTSTAAELNILDGVTSNKDELNITDGGQTTERVLNVHCKSRAYLSGAQNNTASGSNVKVLLDAESYDIGSDFDTANSRFVAPVTGYYQVCAVVSFQSLVANKRYAAMIYVNGVQYSVSMLSNGTDTTACKAAVSDIVFANAGEYIELYSFHNDGASTSDLTTGAANTYLAIHLLSV